MKPALLLTVTLIAFGTMSFSQSMDKSIKSTFIFPTIQHNPSDLTNGTSPSAAKEMTIENSQEDIIAINTQIELLNKQLEELKKLKASLDNEIVVFFDDSSSICCSRLESTEELVNQSNKTNQSEPEYKREVLLNEAKELIQQADNLTTSKESAKELEELAIKKQIDASKIYGELSKEKFNDNRALLNQLMDSPSAKLGVVSEAKVLVYESEHSMRMAFEIRAEAEQEKNVYALLGILENAEEKEFMALETQKQAIQLFQEFTCSKK